MLPDSLPREFRRAPAFLVRDAVARGVSRDRMNASDLCAPYWGIRAVSDGDLEREAACRAYAVRLGEGAVFSFATAAMLWGMPLPLALAQCGDLHVTVEAPGRAVRAAGIVGHRADFAAGDRAVVHGLPVTSAVRTWCDLATMLSMPHLVAAGDRVVARRRPLARIEELQAGVRAHARMRGARGLRAAVPLLDGRAESPAESELRVIFVEAGLPKMDINVALSDDSGRFIARPDIRFAEFRVIVEYEGDVHRVDRAQWNKDMRRTSKLFDRGEHVMRVGAPDLRNPGPMLDMLKRQLARRGWSP